NIRHAYEPAQSEGIACAGSHCSRSDLHLPQGAATQSSAEDFATLGAATRQNLAAVSGLHTSAEAVIALALEVAGLERALGGHGGTCMNETERTGNSIDLPPASSSLLSGRLSQAGA